MGRPTRPAVRVAMPLVALTLIGIGVLSAYGTEAALAAPGPKQTVEIIENKVEATRDAIEDIIAAGVASIEAAGSRADAEAVGEQRNSQIANIVDNAVAFVDSKAALYPDDEAVQQALAEAREDLELLRAEGIGAIDEAVAAWQAPSSTATTTVSVTTTTVPATTTTTTVPATTTTPAAAAPAPPAPPPRSDAAYMPNLPEAVVPGEADREAAMPAEGDGDMVAVGYVRRVVDSQLPAGVSAVAAGPLVVLGLIVDAIRAAGGLMLVPWILLGIYMTGLLRGWRGFTNPT